MASVVGFSGSTEDLVVQALRRVGCDSLFLTARPSGAEWSRTEVREWLLLEMETARKELLADMPAIWNSEQRTLSVDVTLPSGWYRLPADMLSWDMKPTALSARQHTDGTMIYMLPSPVISYVRNRDSTDAFYPEFSRALIWNFLAAISLCNTDLRLRRDGILQEAEKASLKYRQKVREESRGVAATQRSGRNLTATEQILRAQEGMLRSAGV